MFKDPENHSFGHYCPEWTWHGVFMVSIEEVKHEEDLTALPRPRLQRAMVFLVLHRPYYEHAMRGPPGHSEVEVLEGLLRTLIDTISERRNAMDIERPIGWEGIEQAVGPKQFDVVTWLALVGEERKISEQFVAIDRQIHDEPTPEEVVLASKQVIDTAERVYGLQSALEEQEHLAKSLPETVEDIQGVEGSSEPDETLQESMNRHAELK